MMKDFTKIRMYVFISFNLSRSLSLLIKTCWLIEGNSGNTITCNVNQDLGN